MADTIPILRIEHMTKRYGDKEVLKDASLSIDKGELKVLIGPSGGGKSTLLQCINFLIKPDRGRIWLDGREIVRTKGKDLYEYRQKVGMIFQDFNLFDHLTALHNVQIGLVRVKGMHGSEAKERAVRELERVGLRDYMNQYPAELSGGQKQRVSIARALAMDPEIMLLDEPTSALDPELISEVLDVIRALRADGMTMIMSTHQIGFASELADELLFLEDGVIAETGPAAKILYSADSARTREFCSKITELYGSSST
ncbi:MAG: amino acid ABC transporter ATP-binding protein [Deltaproteobacteria bacterium]|nr:amino acid ABC transporter ATP-binding protein [Deltaproteobacteria bacterium]